MRKKINIRKIISKRSYSTEEISVLLGVHIQTIRVWRKEGMLPIELNISPYLFLGSDIKSFLINQKQLDKVTLGKDQFYCLKCRKAVTPPTINVIDRKIKLGGGKHSSQLTGTCPTCTKSLRKFSTLEIAVSIPIKPEIKKKIDRVGDQLSMF